MDKSGEDHRLVTNRISNQTGKHIRIIGAKFFTLGEGSYKYGKKEKLKSINTSKQVIRNMKKKTYVQLILKEAIFSRKDGCQTNA